MTNFDPIDEALNIEVSKTPKINHVKKEDTSDNDVTKDYDYTRANLYSLIEKGQETLNGIMELAGDSASPRAFEVAGQIIKSVADTTDKLMDLQKKVKEVEEEKSKTTNNVTNNALFVGSTSELSKMLKQGILNNSDQDKKIKDD
jgi:tetrahydrodipicolinate N-succinyltransferase